LIYEIQGLLATSFSFFVIEYSLHPVKSVVLENFGHITHPKK